MQGGTKTGGGVSEVGPGISPISAQTPHKHGGDKNLKVRQMSHYEPKYSESFTIENNMRVL
jgi:hypothetical protein